MIVFTFPGQGSQKPGMGAPWLDHPSWELVGEASEAAGRDVGHLLLARRRRRAASHAERPAVDVRGQPGGARRGRAPRRRRRPPSPATASASTPRWSPPARSSFEDGVRLVAERGDAMQAAADDRAGTMAAVLGLDDDTVEVACAQVDGDVWVANYNAPGQVVIAGVPGGDRRASAAAKELGAKKVLPIAVSGAFHTPFMAPARDRLRKALAEADLRDADMPVFANVDAAAHTAADEWAGPAGRPAVQPGAVAPDPPHLAEAGCATFVELGPGTRPHRHGQAHDPRHQTARRSTRRTSSTGCSRTSRPPHRPSAVGTHEGEHLFATERLVVSPAAGVFEPRTRSRRGHRCSSRVRSSAPSAAKRSARPFAGILMGVLAVAGERVIDEPAHRLAASRLMPGARDHRLGHRPARASRHQRRPRGTPRHHRRVDHRAHRHPRAPHRRHHRRARDRGRARRDGRRRRRRRRHRPSAPRHHAPPTSTVPATASAVQDALGIDGGACDLNAACSGFVYGLVHAHGLLATGRRARAAHRRRDHEPHHRPGRPQHRHPLRRRRRRGRARGRRRPRPAARLGPRLRRRRAATCCTPTSAAS